MHGQGETQLGAGQTGIFLEVETQVGKDHPEPGHIKEPKDRDGDDAGVHALAIIAHILLAKELRGRTNLSH